MAWIAAAALAAGVLASTQQGASSGASQRQATISGANAQSQGQSFTPTASTAQRAAGTETDPQPTFDFPDAQGQSAQQAASPPASGAADSSGRALSNVNEAVQLGSNLQQIFQGQGYQPPQPLQRPGPAQPFRATALDQDPRLQQLLSLRG